MGSFQNPIRCDGEQPAPTQRFTPSGMRRGDELSSHKKGRKPVRTLSRHCSASLSSEEAVVSPYRPLHLPRTLCLSTLVTFLAPPAFTLPRSLQSACSVGAERLPTRRRAASARMALEELGILALEELAAGDLLGRGARDTQVVGAQP